MTHDIYDLVVLGGGPGGTKAALLAAASGLRTALVERKHLGGVCLNHGCIPSKLLLGATASAPLLHTQKKLKTVQGDIVFSLPAMQQRKDRIVKASRQALAKQLEQAGIVLFTGEGALASHHELTVSTASGTTAIRFKKLVIATGSAPSVVPGLVPDGVTVLDSNHMLALSSAPRDLVIIGGGAIGLEMGDIFSRLGTQVTLMEALPQLVPGEDTDIGEALQKILKREGWTIHTGKRVTQLTIENGRAILTLEDASTVSAEKVLMAAGRMPVTHALGLDRAKISTYGNGWISTDEYLLAAPDIYAIGDANGRTLLAHAAEHQAHYALSHILEQTLEPYAALAMPSCVHGHTEIMRTGATVRELSSKHQVFVSRFMLVANPIAQSYGATQGFIKAVWVKNKNTYKLQGVCAIGHGVSHLAATATIMVQQVWKREDVYSIIYAHPTLDEALAAALHAPLEV